MPAISRRDFLALGATAAAAVPIARTTAWRPPHATPAGEGLFPLGVTSGDPDATSAVLWTRLISPGGDRDPLDESVTVAWELSDTDTFDEVAASGDVIATSSEGHSVHAIAALAGPAWYRFRVGDAVSPVGRVAPVPADPTELRIAAASCQHFETGFYAAHRDIAEWAPDLVLFLGDFIYESGGHAVGGEFVRSVGGGEARSIADYRERYRQYLGDPDLRASRAAAPWVVIWDDHEVENNYASIAPEDVRDLPTFADRRLAAYQAWWEHMPVRFGRPASLDDITIYRTVSWGHQSSRLADLIMLDGRTYRTNQACLDAELDIRPACPGAGLPSRTMLGAEQEAWVADQLASTTARWPVIGQQTVMSDVRLPNGAILNYDQWDGYHPARERFLEAAKAADRVVVLSGDIHLAGIGRLPGVGVEFVATGISSPPPPVPPDTVAALGDVVDAEVGHRGYTRHVVTHDEWTAEFRIVDDVADPSSPVGTWKSFVVTPDRRDVVTPR